MKKATIGLIIVILFGVFTGCEDRRCQDATSHLDGYAKNLFFNFKVGSYWIYQDSLGNIDSTWVSSTSDSYVSPVCFESCVCQFSSTISNNNLQVIGSSQNVPCSIQGYKDPAGFFSGCFQLWFSNDAFDTTMSSPSDSAILIKLNNYQVNQFTFSNAIKIVSTGSGCPYIIVVSDTGIVEKEGEANSPLKMIRYSLK